MPPSFRPTSQEMMDGKGVQRWKTGWALPASVALHLLVAAILIVELPDLTLPEPEEQAVPVELVPPPPEPEPAKQEPPPAPAQSEKPEEAQTQPPPPPQPEQQTQAAPPPPNVLQPVVRFGEKEEGPRQALDGASAEEPADAPSPEPVTPETPEEPASAAATGSEGQGASANPEVLASPDGRSAAGEPPAGPEDPVMQVTLPETSIAPTPRPDRSAAAPAQRQPPEVERLLSRSATGGATATTAMGGLSREARGGKLCVSELQSRLFGASPPYYPDLLPSYPLESGNVLDKPVSAFRMRGQWYQISFRCTVDDGATRVTSFAYRVGGQIPRGEWARLGLPEG